MNYASVTWPNCNFVVALHKVDVPNSSHFLLIGHLYLTTCVDMCVCKIKPIAKGHVVKKGWTMCLSMDILVNTMGDLYDHLMDTRIFFLIVNRYHMSSQNCDESGYALDLDFITISC